jgi:hypothetical protein
MSEGHPPPSSLPAYVRDALEPRSAGELEQIAAWASEEAERRRGVAEQKLKSPPETEGSVVGSGKRLASEVGAAIDDSEIQSAGGRVYFYWLKTNCNKSNCSKCPHGPYPYIKFRDGSGTVRTRYGRSAVDALGIDGPD